MTESIGQRVKLWRRRRSGMTQQTLAGLSGLSQTYISKIERGERPLDQKSAQVAIALALNITVSQLLGHPRENGDPIRQRATRYVPTIRSALIELRAGERRKPTRDLDTLRAATASMTELRVSTNYGDAAALLSGLLSDLAGHGRDAGPTMIEALFNTRAVLKVLGFLDLARMAAELGLTIAEDYGDPAWHGQAISSWVSAVPMEDAALSAQIVRREADALQGVGSRDAQETYGSLHLTAALYDAATGRTDDAWSHLGEAAQLANALGPLRGHGFNACVFGPSNLDVWRVSIAAELGDTATAMKVAERIDLGAIAIPIRHVYYFVDLARALAAGCKDHEAMHALARAERASPQHFRFNPVAVELAPTLVRRAKRADAEKMATLARKLGLSLS